MAHIWPRQIWSSGVYLKRSCKMQLRRVGLRSIGPSSQKFWPNLIFGPIARLQLKCKTSKWWQKPIYVSIILKNFVCHFLIKLHPFLTWEGGGSSKKVFLGLPSVHEQENLLNLIQYNYWLAFNHRIGLSQFISKIIDKVEFGNDRYLKCIKFDPINTCKTQIS